MYIIKIYKRVQPVACARSRPADVLIPIPQGISDQAAATLVMKGMTAQ